MIPKIIHYCWFGKKKKNKVIKKCIESWKKYCPDYKIIEWNEDNFDINCCKFAEEAYENKKWAFVTDYVRFKILNEYGGIYLDTDVELLTNLNGFLNNNFTAFENPTSVATGLIMGCEKNNDLCMEMIKQYEKESFIQSDGKYNLKTVCKRVTEYFVNQGLVLQNITQEVNNYIIYDTTYFNPININTGMVKLNNNTVSIHHYTGTWLPLRQKIKKYFIRIIGPKMTSAFVKIKKTINRQKEI